jgi:hypothetical protein
MKIMAVRSFWGLLLCGIAASSGLYAQDPRGVGADIKIDKVERAKSAKPEKPTAIYTIPESASWWHGGGPGPAGVGAK